VRFCVDNLAQYWKPLADDVAALLDAEPSREVHPDSFEWCALGALRLHRTAFHGDVVSKRAAADHGRTVLPEALHEVLDDAVAVRTGTWPSPAVDADRMLGAVEIVRWCVREVSEAARPTG
jgi:hypothetical protein